MVPHAFRSLCRHFISHSVPDIVGIVLQMNQSLVAAASEGDTQAVCKLIDDGAVVDWVAAPASVGSNDHGKRSIVGSALHCASRYGHEESVRCLLEVLACCPDRPRES